MLPHIPQPGWRCALALFCAKKTFMRTFRIAIAFVVLAACTQQPASPTGVYRLATATHSIVLDVRSSGDYVLQVDGPGRNTDEIRGRWEEEQGADRDITFHDIVWHGSEPEAGAGFWPVAFERNGGICLDGEGLTCFAKDEAG